MMVEMRQLGKSNVKVSAIIFGAWAIGGWMWGGSEERDAIEAIQTSLDNGINTIDTAAIYGMGYSEELVAKALKGRREKAIIATKCGFRWDTQEGSNPWPQKDLKGNSIVVMRNSKPESIILECERSLKRLGTDYIDLYQIHSPDPSIPIEVSWKAMVKLKEQGKVRAIGVSNYDLQQLQAAQAVHPIDSLQPPYSLVRRGIEEDIVPYCQQNHIGIIAYSPLERGLLTGKISSTTHFPEGDHRSNNPTFSQENRERVNKALERIRPIAEKHHATLAQVIIHCTYHMPGITAAIVGARNAKQAMENAQAANLKLSSSEREQVVKELEEVPILQLQ